MNCLVNLSAFLFLCYLPYSIQNDPFAAHLDIDQFDVIIETKFASGSACSSGDQEPLDPISVTVPRGPGSSALFALETAAQDNSNYRFTALYKGGYGYIVKSYNGLSANINCAWNLYIQPQQNDFSYPNPYRYTLRGLNHYLIPVNNRTIILQYEEFSEYSYPNNTFQTAYSRAIDQYSITVGGLFGSQSCVVAQSFPQVAVTIDAGRSYQNAMERAADTDQRYNFQAQYYGSNLGYSLMSIGLVSTNGPCYFCITYAEPQTDIEYFPNYGITNFVMPVNDGYIRFLYQTQCDTIETARPNSTTSAPSVSGPSQFAFKLSFYSFAFLVIAIAYALI